MASTRSRNAKAVIDPLEDWLPITASRNAKWWYSTSHNVTAVVGVGVLSFPQAMHILGLGPGVVVLVLSWAITLFTLWQMVQMHEMIPGKRFDRYHELAQYAFGEKLGLYILIPQQLIIEVGVNIVYMVAGGQSLMRFCELVKPDHCPIKDQKYWITIFASSQFLLAQLPTFNSIIGISLAAAIMSLSYSTIAWTSSIDGEKHNNPGEPCTTISKGFAMLNALGQMAFAYAGHNVVLEIQATIPSTRDRPSKKPMWKGVILAYVIVAACYFPVALVGWKYLDNKVSDNVLFYLKTPRLLIAIADMMVVIHVLGSYQLYAMPVYDMLESVLVKTLKLKPTFLLRLVVRSTYVACTYILAMAFPYFGALLGFFGGFAFAPTTYFMPCIISLLVYKPKMFSPYWLINWRSRSVNAVIDPLEDWLPITASRNAKWWYSTSHNVTAVVGFDVLSFPQAMHTLGLGPSVVVLVLSWAITLFTLWQMVQMHEMIPGKRFDRYHELAQYAFGEKLGLYILIPQQLIIEVGVNIVYMVAGGQSLMRFCELVKPDHCPIKDQKYWITIFASSQFLLAQLPTFNSIIGISLAAAIMSLSYSTIAWTSSIDGEKHNNNTVGSCSTISKGFAMLNALGQMAFAYAGHNVVLEIQATIPSTSDKPSKKPMWRGVTLAYVIVAACYFPIALVGSKYLDDKVSDNVLFYLKNPRPLIAIANMMVVIHVLGSYQLYAMPVYDMIESVLVKNFKLKPTFLLRLIARSAYVAFTYVLAMGFPYFGALLGFFGGFAFAPTTYFMPCIISLLVYKPKIFNPSWLVNWVCIILGVLLMIGATIGGGASLVASWKTFQGFPNNTIVCRKIV